MKKRWTLLCAVLMAATAATAQEDFKMHVRLWPNHHTNDELSHQLLEALRQYPGFCDEVWFCTEPQLDDLDVHRRSAQKMGVVAQEMRRLGIRPSVQLVTVGHPEGATPLPPDERIHWNTMVGAHGERTNQQSCPRQEAFREWVAAWSAMYAEAVQPTAFWVDDDLRLTAHYPAPETCYCDTCLSEFSREQGRVWTRETLVEALDQNQGEGTLRKAWIAFCQEGEAGLMRAIARAVHRVSPQTRMGLQHVAFHNYLLEGYDWNPLFRACWEETGLPPVSRPGNGYYNDHSPRGMFMKGLDMARQLRRLDARVTDVAPELEGHLHKSTGKSPRGVCVETMYYLSMGANQMSYALVCSAMEPMQWYADNYFRHLQQWHRFAKDYVAFNRGSEPGGVNPFISADHVLRSDVGPWAWTTTTAQSGIYGLAPLALPLTPDGSRAVALMFDGEAFDGTPDAEFRTLQRRLGLVVTADAWERIKGRGLAEGYAPVEPECLRADAPGLPRVVGGSESERQTRCFQTPEGRRIAVIGSYAADLTERERLLLLRTIDWASGFRLPAIVESQAQVACVPRVDADGRLRSVALLNSSISPQEGYTLRLRGAQGRRLRWHVNGQRPRTLRARDEGSDVLVRLPGLSAWDFGWLSVK